MVYGATNSVSVTAAIKNLFQRHSSNKNYKGSGDTGCHFSRYSLAVKQEESGKASSSANVCNDKHPSNQ